jgi:ATP-dependent protease HslVU (ClpYQ) peptidase subunit
VTCIIGVVQHDVVYLGADSCVSNSSSQEITARSKVCAVGDFLVGASGYVRFNNILTYQFTPRAQEPGEDDEHYVVVAFADALRLRLKELGYVNTDEGQDTMTHNDALLAYHHQLYYLSTNFSVTTNRDNLFAIGSGSDFALGAMWAMRDVEVETRIRTALEISAHFAVGVAEPFVVLKQG